MFNVIAATDTLFTKRGLITFTSNVLLVKLIKSDAGSQVFTSARTVNVNASASSETLPHLFKISFVKSFFSILIVPSVAVIVANL